MTRQARFTPATIRAQSNDWLWLRFKDDHVFFRSPKASRLTLLQFERRNNVLQMVTAELTRRYRGQEPFEPCVCGEIPYINASLGPITLHVVCRNEECATRPLVQATSDAKLRAAWHLMVIGYYEKKGEDDALRAWPEGFVMPESDN